MPSCPRRPSSSRPPTRRRRSRARRNTPPPTGIAPTRSAPFRAWTGCARPACRCPSTARRCRASPASRWPSDGTFWSLSDNGFGTKLNSPDAALMLHHLRIDWANGKVERIETIFLTDPDRKVWFPIVNEGTKERYLTGADFDIEVIQPVADGFWIGDEFGPFLIKVDKAGKVLRSSTPSSTASRSSRPTTRRDPPGQSDRRSPPSTSSAPAAMRASPSRRTAPSSTACSKAPSSSRTAPWRWSTATVRSASSNSTPPSDADRPDLALSASPTAATRSATST